ncbi:uncharacterized protein LOC117653095 [Thrips palmi]|uniref:Uncharacterized protein LOC117653095 n=1 Tax=Thrips palmi TaxID=161013 RepID=A0A6P9A8K0_THRPL|nr:uncharacterized protein LOC117653095 [Thrips palmi]
MFINYLDNGLYLCFKLFHMLKVQPCSTASVVEFAVVSLRLSFVGMFTTSVHQQWRDLKPVLFSVLPECHSTAGIRFSTQISEQVALTGLGVYSLTRPFLLSVIGFLGSFQTVLLQEGSSSPGNHSKFVASYS